jgi:hypothetical protein
MHLDHLILPVNDRESSVRFYAAGFEDRRLGNRPIGDLV